MSLRLSCLLEGIADVSGDDDIVVDAMTLDSRRIERGAVFVALPGRHGHGLDHVVAARAAGAGAILADPQGFAGAVPPDVRVLPELRDRLGLLADRLHRAPSAALKVIGVTGTNGKTSTVQLLAQALRGLGHPTATIGTLGSGMGERLEPAVHTTPDVLSVHALLARFRAAGATHVAMEVSSHALDQGRVDAVRFAVAVFTNLSRDHLDYHLDMAAYADAKAKLFDTPGLAHAVLNFDDPEGRRIGERLAPDIQTIPYGMAAAAAVRALRPRFDADGIAFEVQTPWGSGQVRSPLLGAFNVHNLLAVIASLGALGHTLEDILAQLPALAPVRGRMNRLGGADQPLVVVDYAHTPDALEKALTTLRQHGRGRLLCVFGCGGERDRGKRPQMGRIAESLADRVWITDDNPRGEDGDAIVSEILAGLVDPAGVTVERDRGHAIVSAVAAAAAGDIVLIAGKGHEAWQERSGQRIAFDDLEQARRALEMRPC